LKGNFLKRDVFELFFRTDPFFLGGFFDFLCRSRRTDHLELLGGLGFFFRGWFELDRELESCLVNARFAFDVASQRITDLLANVQAKT